MESVKQVIFRWSNIANGPMNLTGHLVFDRERIRSRSSWLGIYGIAADMAVNPKVLHGAKAEVVSKANEFGALQCDALITDKKGLALTMPMADCPPLALYDPVSEVIALLHCGWKPLAAGIIESTIQKMKNEFNVDPQNLKAEIGPGICQTHYWVGPEVFKALGLPHNEGKPLSGRVDLAGYIKNTLRINGVEESNIYDNEVCTFDSKDLYSFRRDKKSDPLDAQMALLIMK